MTFSQSGFIEALLDPERPVPAGVRSISSRSSKRFNVYRNNVVAGLVAALEASFPIIRKLVGAEFFSAMAGEFVRRHPPSSPLIMFYGEDFPDFLSSFAPVQHLPYLPDVAKLELEMRISYHSADAVPVAPEAASRIPPDRLPEAQLEFAPALRLLRSIHPIHGIWLANAEGGPTPSQRAEDVAVVREQFDPRVILLEKGGYEFIESLAAGHSLGEAHASAIVANSGFGLDRLLLLLLRSRAVTSFCLPES